MARRRPMIEVLRVELRDEAIRALFSASELEAKSEHRLERRGYARGMIEALRIAENDSRSRR